MPTNLDAGERKANQSKIPSSHAEKKNRNPDKFESISIFALGAMIYMANVMNSAWIEHTEK